MDPYKVLGVSESASADEIKAAYRALVKKYHPDRYTDETLKAEATEKIKEINEAYDIITNSSKNGSRASSNYNRGYSGGYYGENADAFRQVEMLINAGRLGEALMVLEAIGLRNARWNYLYGVVALKMNRFDEAATFFSKAYFMEPNNFEYKNAYEKTHMTGATYSKTYNASHYDTDCCGNECCNLCTTMICCNLMCNACCR